MNNEDIRKEISDAGLKLWQVAKELNINDGNFSRRLREELSEDDKSEIRTIIQRLKSN